VKRAIATEFEVSRFYHLLRRVIIIVYPMADRSAPRAVNASPYGVFPVSPLFPPAVTTRVCHDPWAVTGLRPVTRRAQAHVLVVGVSECLSWSDIPGRDVCVEGIDVEMN
jgi:hypothetical protein